MACYVIQAEKRSLKIPGSIIRNPANLRKATLKFLSLQELVVIFATVRPQLSGLAVSSFMGCIEQDPVGSCREWNPVKMEALTVEFFSR